MNKEEELLLTDIIVNLYEGDIDFTNNEEQEIDRLIEIFNSYEIKNCADLELKLLGKRSKKVEKEKVMSKTLIKLFDELIYDDCLEQEEEMLIKYLIEILNSYEIKTPEDLENKLKESEKSKSTKKPTKKNGPDTSLSKIMNEMSECFFDSDEDIHVSPEKEDVYTTTLLSLSDLFRLHKINTIHDLRNVIEKELHTNTNNKININGTEDKKDGEIQIPLDDLIEILNRENYHIVSKNNLATLVTQEEKENYAKTLTSIYKILTFYNIYTINDLKDVLKKSSSVSSFEENIRTVSEDDMIDTILSLASAFQEAGGRISGVDTLKNISAFEFIRRIAPNKIRFYVTDKE